MSVAVNARRGMVDDGKTGEFDDVSTSAYSVLAYLTIGSTGLWAFFSAHSVPLSFAEVKLCWVFSVELFQHSLCCFESYVHGRAISYVPPLPPNT